jgi:glycosyltransferase involved in cell wall biosynthesis
LVEEAAAELPNLDYRGWLGREALLEAFDECEVLVMPSSVESFGTVAMEAMVRRRVVVVSPHCGICQWPELAGGLVVMDAGETLTAALLRLAAMDPDERSAVAAKAREQAERFNRETLEDWVATLRTHKRAQRGEAER